MANTAFGSNKNKFRPFQQGGHYIAGASSGSKDPKFTDAFDFNNGIKNIKTGQDLEAILTFLLSYCLCIDGQDLARIDKSRINHLALYTEIKEGIDFANNAIKHQNDFHLKEAYFFDRKLIMNRGKQQQRESTVKFNIYPIPRIFQLLKLIIAKHRPVRAYKGNDPFRLYNFQTDDFDGKQKWKQITNVVTNNLKRMSGTLLSSQRGTFSSYLSDLAVPNVVCQAFLKHSFKQSTFEKHYLKRQLSDSIILLEAILRASSWRYILRAASSTKAI